MFKKLNVKLLNKLYEQTFHSNHIRFQYGSNYNFRKGSKFNQSWTLMPYLFPISRYLVLNGNIGDLDSSALHGFLSMCASVYDIVWWIPGPLELSHPTKCMFSRLDQMREIALSIDGTIIVGSKSESTLYEHNTVILSTTGWGTSSKYDKNVHHYTSGSDKLESLDVNTMASCEEKWIRKRIHANSGIQTLLFTHHDVSEETNLTLNANKHVNVHLCGNTQPISGLKSKSVWFGCNPFFYKGSVYNSYSPIAIVEVKCKPFNGGSSSPLILS